MATPAAAAVPQEGPVVLINPIQVAPEQEEAFLAAWKEARDHLSAQDGYLSTKLHKSLDPAATYRFINVAQGQSAQHWQAALESDAFRQIVQRTIRSSLMMQSFSEGRHT